jgi:glycosyltransferase involved in cell wall biosynthesis
MCAWMKIAIVTIENRDEFQTYGDAEPWFGPAPAALLDGLATLPECEVHVLACTHKPLAAPARLAPNIHYHVLPVARWGWMRGAYAGCVLAVRRKLSEIQPFLVHGQGTERYCALAAVYSGFPNLVTIHGNMRHIAALVKARPCSFYWLTARLESLAVRRSRGVICLTNYTRRSVEPLAQRTWLVPNPVHGSFFDVRPEPSPERALLCVGNILPWKNQAGLIRALDPVAGRRDFKLVFLGKTTVGDAYTQEFDGLVRSRPWCQHVGNLKREELQAELGKATALVIPSLEDNCPMVVLEAMAAGLPVVASRLGGLPDLVEEGRTGFLFDPLDAAGLGHGVEQILGDRSRALEMGRRGRTAALDRFHPRVVARRHLEIYQEVLSTSG